MLLFHAAQTEHTSEQREDKMLHLVGAALGLLMVVVCLSKGLNERNQIQKSPTPDSSAVTKTRPLNDEDFHLLARVLSLGLVDADPNYLHHLKGFRDLHGG